MINSKKNTKFVICSFNLLIILALLFTICFICACSDNKQAENSSENSQAKSEKQNTFKEINKSVFINAACKELNASHGLEVDESGNMLSIDDSKRKVYYTGYNEDGVASEINFSSEIGTYAFKLAQDPNKDDKGRVTNIDYNLTSSDSADKAEIKYSFDYFDNDEFKSISIVDTIRSQNGSPTEVYMSFNDFGVLQTYGIKCETVQRLNESSIFSYQGPEDKPESLVMQTDQTSNSVSINMSYEYNEEVQDYPCALNLSITDKQSGYTTPSYKYLHEYKDVTIKSILAKAINNIAAKNSYFCGQILIPFANK